MRGLRRGLDGNALANAFAKQLIERLEYEDALPLPTQKWDVVVDDPDMLSKHEFRGFEATTPLAAAVAAPSKRALWQDLHGETVMSGRGRDMRRIPT